MIANYANVTHNHKYYVVNAWAIISGVWIKNHLLSPKHSQRPSLKFEWNRLVSPRFEWTLKFERSPRIEGITLRSPRIECFTYFWGWSSTWWRMCQAHNMAGPQQTRRHSPPGMQKVRISYICHVGIDANLTVASRGISNESAGAKFTWNR